jgi:hypothetical protein
MLTLGPINHVLPHERTTPRGSLNRTYVILVLPKCLLTWGYVEVEAAAFCLQHDRRHGESAGPVEIDLPEHLPQE